MSEFTPLPLRARSVLEIIDTSLKVYKQYFLVLLGWSAILNLIGLLPSLLPQEFSFLAYFSILLTPLQIAVAACTVAAAVRGQNLTFQQCWQFSRARYGPMLGQFLLACIVGFMCLMALVIPGSILIGLAGAAAGIGGGAGSGIAMLVFVIALFIVVLGFGIVAFYGWATMVPLVVCMEEQRPGQSALQRASRMLGGHWSRLIGLSSVLGMAALLILVALLALGSYGIGLDEVRRSITGGTPTPEFTRAVLGMAISYSFVMMFLSPAMLLAMVLFYLDIRVRNEALDLEWAAHQSHAQEPSPSASQPAAASGFETPATPISTPLNTPTTPYQSPVTNEPFTNFSAASPTPTSEAPISEAPVAPPPISEATNAVAWQDLVPESPAPESPPPADVALPHVPLPGAATLTCPRCGATSPAGSSFCMVCGTSLKADAG